MAQSLKKKKKVPRQCFTSGFFMFLKFIFLDIYSSLLKLMINYAKDSEREDGYLFSKYLCELVNVSLKISSACFFLSCSQHLLR